MANVTMFMDVGGGSDGGGSDGGRKGLLLLLSFSGASVPPIRGAARDQTGTEMGGGGGIKGDANVVAVAVSGGGVGISPPGVARLLPSVRRVRYQQGTLARRCWSESVAPGR